jgi:hypothetical protein
MANRSASACPASTVSAIHYLDRPGNDDRRISRSPRVGTDDVSLRTRLGLSLPVVIFAGIPTVGILPPLLLDRLRKPGVDEAR